MERSDGLCELCRSHDRVQPHHIIGGRGKRLIHETIDSVIVLCHVHHHEDYGAHGIHGSELNITLKRHLQKVYFDKGYNEDQVRTMMGDKLCLDDYGEIYK